MRASLVRTDDSDARTLSVSNILIPNQRIFKHAMTGCVAFFFA